MRLRHSVQRTAAIGWAAACGGGCGWFVIEAPLADDGPSSSCQSCDVGSYRSTTLRDTTLSTTASPPNTWATPETDTAEKQKHIPRPISRVCLVSSTKSPTALTPSHCPDSVLRAFPPHGQTETESICSPRHTRRPGTELYTRGPLCAAWHATALYTGPDHRLCAGCLTSSHRP
jgi:hypothetical protein